MSTIVEANKIDAIGIDEPSGIIVLKIFDHLDWQDEHAHLYILQEKINTYLRFLESNEVLEAYPAAKNRVLQISISFKEKPSANGLRFLDTAAKIIADAGFSLIYSITNAG